MGEAALLLNRDGASSPCGVSPTHSAAHLRASSVLAHASKILSNRTFCSTLPCLIWPPLTLCSNRGTELTLLSFSARSHCIQQCCSGGDTVPPPIHCPPSHFCATCQCAFLGSQFFGPISSGTKVGVSPQHGQGCVVCSRPETTQNIPKTFLRLSPQA